MIKTGETIEWVIEALFNGRKIKGSQAEINPLYDNESIKSNPYCAHGIRDHKYEVNDMYVSTVKPPYQVQSFV